MNHLTTVLLTQASPIRYRQIPSFGQDTIRRFHKNASAMKKLGACDFEDLLQVRMVFHSFSKILTV